MTPVASLAGRAADSREIVLSKSALAGICLITFACGIVTTVMVDRARPRTGDREVAARELDPTPSRSAPTPDQTPATPVAPTVAAVPAAPTPVAPTAAASAAGEAVVVQMLNPNETAKKRSPVTARNPTPIPVHTHPVAAPAIAAKAKPASTTGTALAPPKAKSGISAPTSTPTKKAKTTEPYGPPTEWVDPFSQ